MNTKEIEMLQFVTELGKDYNNLSDFSLTESQTDVLLSYFNNNRVKTISNKNSGDTFLTCAFAVYNCLKEKTLIVVENNNINQEKEIKKVIWDMIKLRKPLFRSIDKWEIIISIKNLKLLEGLNLESYSCFIFIDADNYFKKFSEIYNRYYNPSIKFILNQSNRYGESFIQKELKPLSKIDTSKIDTSKIPTTLNNILI